MSRRKYWLTVSGPEIGDNLVCSYASRKELRDRWRKDAAGFAREREVEPVGGEWFPYFQIEYLGGELEGEFEEVSWLSVFGNGRTGKRRAA
ncbi:MAG: hypothetical protein LBK61_07030 [Spirochaetaceae bacterium]|jgi:hypothetical protein|nr:hypothetical protein [Spirochaetaceae bacterium]